MNAQDIDRAVRRLGREIAERAKASGAAKDLAVVGIRRGGVFLAQRLRAELATALGDEPPAGTLDIALYRDDLAEKGAAPVIGPTDIRFPVQGKTATRSITRCGSASSACWTWAKARPRGTSSWPPPSWPCWRRSWW